MRAAVIDWSGTGNTESIAEAMEKGLKKGGGETDECEAYGKAFATF